MASQCRSIVSDNVDIVQKLSLDGLEHKNVILLQFRGLVLTLVLGEFLQNARID